MNKDFWEKFYEKNIKFGGSPFAVSLAPFIKGTMVDLGCGNGRDVNYFLQCGIKTLGVDQSYEDDYVIKSDIKKYMKYNKSPRHVYTRFFWHAITREEQLAILEWVSDYIYIEARTTEDKLLHKEFGQHKRNYVNVPKLVKDLKDNGFQILRLEEGFFSKFKKENPHLVRVIAKRS